MQDDQLPTIGEVISNWLGVQLPAIPIPMRQTARNFDKAVSKVVLAAGENLEARIKTGTAKTKARGKIDVEGMYRTADERRKLENRAAATQAAIEDLRQSPPQDDAQSEIDDDWLNYFARLVEDKSSEELQALFGKILSGEIKRPGSFSLMTMQSLALISKRDAELLSNLLSFAVAGSVVPFDTDDSGHPTVAERAFLDELRVAGHPSQIGGMRIDWTIAANGQALLAAASRREIAIINNMSEPAKFSIAGQVLTTLGKELLPIANSPPTAMEFLRKIARNIYASFKSAYPAAVENGLLKVHVGEFVQVGAAHQFTPHFTIED
jgi:Protein of unknown function (DUF2806)